MPPRLRSAALEDAARLSRKFVDLVTREFERTGTIVEKYDVERGASDVAGGIRFGCSANQAGFGWTNAAYLELLAGLRSAPAVAAPPKPRTAKTSREHRAPALR